MTMMMMMMMMAMLMATAGDYDGDGDDYWYPRWMETLRVYSPHSSQYAGWKGRYQDWKPMGWKHDPKPKNIAKVGKVLVCSPWLKTRGCEVTWHLTTYMFQVAEIIGTWNAGQHTHILFESFTCCWTSPEHPIFYDDKILGTTVSLFSVFLISSSSLHYINWWIKSLGLR